MRLLLVAHASARWGFGHLNRCRVLAETARREGWQVHLLVRGPAREVCRRLGALGGECEVIPEDAPTADEIERLDVVLGDADRAIIDHPHLDAEQAARLEAGGVPWLTFTHRDHWIGEPDWLVNIRPGLAPRPPEGRTRFLHGPAYAVLRDEFAQGCDQRYRPLSGNPRLFVTFGGGDDFGAGHRLLPPLLATFPGLRLDVVTTTANSGLSAIEELRRVHGKRVALHIGPDRMQPIMCRAGAGLIAGGTTTYELAAVGVPFLVVTLVENQRAQARAWDQLGAAIDIGPVDDMVVERALAGLSGLFQDDDRCRAMREAGRRQVDAWGAERILVALTQPPSR